MAEHHPPDGGEQVAGHDHGGDHRDSEGTERVREVVRDGFYTLLGAASWAFEKTDEMAHSWLHQGQLSGDQSRRRFDEFTSRTRRAGEELGRRVQDTVRTARTSMPLATREQVANLERQVAELSRQIESLKSSGSAPNPPGRERSQT
jgi:polyhydroxyalkanoate synthesis regulator phasin